MVIESGRAGIARAFRSNLAIRLAAAALLIPLTIALAYVGGAAWVALATLISIGLLREWAAIVGTSGNLPLGSGSIGLLLAGVFCGMNLYDLALAAIFCAAALSAILSSTPRFWMPAGVVYAAAPLIAASLLRQGDLGFAAILLVLLLVWGTDSGGYFVGRAVGGPRLWPRISPNKTWAGAVGSLAVALLIALGFAMAQSWSLVPLLAVGAAISIAAQGGDLLESAVKRRFGVKDSGSLIPGHGGLLDRLDGAVTALSLAALIGLLRAGSDGAARGLVVW